MKLEAKIEAVLFWKGEPMSKKRLAEILGMKTEEIDEALTGLKNSLSERGVVLVENNNELALGTPPEMSSLFEKLQKEELNKDLSKASLETLSIILYKNGANRAEIDYIRGVNSSFIIRALSVRGLVEKETDPSDNRRYIYKPTFELLSYMGVKSVEELPAYTETLASLNKASESMKEVIEEIKEEKSEMETLTEGDNQEINQPNEEYLQ